MKLLYEGIEDVRRYYPDIPTRQFDYLIRLDPTFDESRDRVGTYGRWILNLFLKNGNIDVWHITDLLNNFERNKRFLKNKNIMSFKSMEEVDEYLADEDSYNSASARQRLRAARTAEKNVDLEKESKIIYDSPHWSIVTPLTYEASCALGNGTRWCTASRNSREYFDDYTKDGPLYIVKDKDTGERYQLHFETESFMDEYDDPIDVMDLLLTNWDLYDAFDNIGALNEDFKHFEGAYSTLMDNDNVVKYPDELDELTYIGDYGDTDVLKLITTIIVEEGKTLTDNSFWGCENVTTIKISDSSDTTVIEEGTFNETPNLSELYISPRVVSISNEATYHKNITVYGKGDSEAERWATYNGFEFIEVKDFDEKMQRKPMKFKLNEGQDEHRYYLCGNYGLIGTPYPNPVTRAEAEKQLASGHLLPSWGYVHEMYTQDDGIRREAYSMAPILYSKEDFDKFESKLKKSLSEVYLIEGIDDVRKFYPTIEKSDFDRIIRLDPTFRSDKDKVGTYGKWLLNLFKKGNLDNEGHVRDLLTRFEDVKNRLKTKNKDIMQYKSLEEVDEMLDNDDSYKDLSARQKLRRTQNAVHKTDVNKDAILVYEDSTWEVWTPLTYESSCKLGQGTRWCTASTGNDYYYNYYKNRYGGNYYININKSTGEKFQFHFESRQFANAEDYSIDLKEFMELPENAGLAEYYLPIAKEATGEGSEPTIHTFDRDDLIGMYSNVSDINKDLITNLFYGDDIMPFFWSDWSGIASSVRSGYVDIPESCQNMLNQIMEVDEFHIKDVEEYDSELFDEILRAALSAEESGSANECYESFDKSLGYLIDNLRNAGYEAQWANNEYTLQIKREMEDTPSPFELLMIDEDEEDTLIQEAVEDSIDFKEPYYGWDGFDEEYFKEELEYRIREYADKEGIELNETN